MTAKLTPAQAKALKAFQDNGGVWHHNRPTFNFHRGALNGLINKGLVHVKGSAATGDFRYELAGRESHEHAFRAKHDPGTGRFFRACVCGDELDGWFD